MLVTLDVTALYTNITHEEGLEACRRALDMRNVLDPPMDDIIHLISLILKNNNFSFNDEHYLQKYGTTMSTRMAPSFASVFIDKLEEDLLCRATYITNQPSGGGT